MKQSGSGRPYPMVESTAAVYCSRCHVLALAVLDSQPLCCDCLFKIAVDKDLGWINTHLSPIDIPIRGPVAARDRGCLTSDKKSTEVA